MAFRIWLAMLCLLTAGQAAGREAATDRQHNRLAAGRYYARLLAAQTPRLAELTLFTNMLPKGGDLHHHYSGAIYAETYLDWVAAQNYCIYRHSDAALKIEKYRIETRPQALGDAARSLCVSAEAAHQDNHFYRELLQRWSDKDYGNHFHEQRPPDQQFFDTFGYFGDISTVDYRQGLRELKARAQAENVGYLETMLKGGPSVDKPELATLLNGLGRAASEQQLGEALTRGFELLAGDADTAARLDAYLKMLEDAAGGIDDPGFKLRFQSYVSRNSSPAKVFSSLYTSFAAASRSPLIVGINIVGPENGYVAMRDYSLHMKMFAFLKQRFPGMKLAMHAGELTLGMVPPEGLRSHIREAVLVAGANRIGHGVDIAHETDAPGLLEIMRQRKTVVEIALTSNAFILGVKNEAHPLSLYMSHKVPFVIATDDAGVSRNNLSHEYLLYTSRYRPSYTQLKQTVYNSIRYSFLPDVEKQDELHKLDKRFAEFEARVARLPLPGG